MLIVKSKGTFVNGDFTSKDIKLWPGDTFSDFILLVNSTLLSTVYSDLLSGERNLAGYLASW